jgi:hypothetical protein
MREDAYTERQIKRQLWLLLEAAHRRAHEAPTLKWSQKKEAAGTKGAQPTTGHLYQLGEGPCMGRILFWPGVREVTPNDEKQ